MKKSLRQFRIKYSLLCWQYLTGEAGYDELYDFLEGWAAHVQYANSYSLRTNILASFEKSFCHEISSKEISRQEIWAS